MTELSHCVFITLVTLYLVTGQHQGHEQNNIIKDNKHLKETFNKLVHAVTSVNEERLESLKKFYALQNYLPKVTDTRTRDDKNGIIAFIVPNKKKYVTKYDVDINGVKKGPNIKPRWTPLKAFKKISVQYRTDENSKRIASNDLSLDSSADIDGTLRAWKGCSKSAAKVCKKACISAFKDVCSDYKCSKRMKKAGKKSCKSNCKSKFIKE